MSGIVGLVQFDGSPVEFRVLRRLTNFLGFRGPDAQQTWIKDNVGFAHTLFKTTEESVRDSQPLTLDGRTWIVADARIDAREDLFAALNAAGEPTGESCWTDAELILRAYRVWGLNCVEHLLGDFAFGIWDDSKKHLLCARDHMGVKPFYYAQLGCSVIFSNTLDCIRQYSRVSDKLNDLAIADFLLFGFNQDPATTSFAGIQRIPPAHSVTWSRDGLTTRRYWSMPVDDPIFHKRAEAYTEHFHDLLRKCVADRLRTRQIWVFMSGGIDSSTLASAAHELLSGRDAHFDLRALTKTDSFVPDEGAYARAAADYLGIPIRYHRWTEGTNREWERIQFFSPEPCLHAWLIPAENQFWEGLKNYSRVFFYGEGPDNALHCDWAPYLSGLISHRNYGALSRAVFATLFSERRPPFSARILNMIRTSVPATTGGPHYPEWLNRSLESRLSLRDRWSTVRSGSVLKHPWRPHGYASLHNPLWQTTFENFDIGAARSSHEMRYPFVDIRMLRFLLSVPVLPWCRSKRLLRVAMRNKLPNQILRRKKTATESSKVFKYMEDFCQLPLVPTIDLANYVNFDRVPRAMCSDSTESNLRVRSLNHWLQHSRSHPHNLQRESVCEQFV